MKKGRSRHLHPRLTTAPRHHHLVVAALNVFEGTVMGKCYHAPVVTTELIFDSCDDRSTA